MKKLGRERYRKIIKDKENAMLLQIEETDRLRLDNSRLRRVIKKLNRKWLCPSCNSPYIAYTPEEYFHCSSCNNNWTKPNMIISLEDAITRDFGEIGTLERDEFEKEVIREYNNENV